MKKLFALTALLMAFFFLIILQGCKKTGTTFSNDAMLFISADTVFFDTVFTTIGSVTKSFKIFNPNEERIILSEVKLLGNQQFFKINVDGSPGNASGIEIDANDSVYVFASVTIDANAQNLPFIVQDSIGIFYNGNLQKIQLLAYGKNAIFLRNNTILSDTVWNNNLPVVVTGPLKISEGKTLTIQAGTQVYAHADAPFIVDGSLVVNGTVTDPVIFQGDRLDEPYKHFPASWPGIVFNEQSINNVFTHAVIKNAYQALVVTPSLFPGYKLELNECIISNAYDAGILAVATNIKAQNCLILNCGSNISIAGGGNYRFTYNTVASFNTFYIDHKKPVLFIADQYNNESIPLNAEFTNCIFYGDGGSVENEISISKKGSGTFNLSFTNVLYKNKSPLTYANEASLWNINPQFDSINVSKNIYNLRLKPFSAAVNAGVAVPGIPFDLDGLPREAPAGLPDLGCYELQ